MQIDVFPKGVLPPQGGGTPEFLSQEQRHQRILRWRTLQNWWYPILFVLLGSVITAILGDFVLDQSKIVLGALIGVPLIFLALRRLEFGLVVFAVCASPFMPSALKVSTLYISPVVPLLVLLFLAVLVRTAFAEKNPVFPSVWMIWPLYGLIILAVLSEVIGQATWLYGVPHQVLQNPASFEEGIALAIYCVPLLVVFTVTTILSNKDKWIVYVQYTFLGLALLDAAVIMIAFKRIGADIYAFRYASPSIGWMPLEAMAQLLVLGCIIGYVRFLHATGWTARIIYGLALGTCLLALYFSLENSWWLEAAAGLAVITVVYSRKLFVLFCIAGLPLLPLVKAFIQKLQAVKSVDALRLVIWQDMLRAWSKRPILGVGPGNLWAYDQVFSHLPAGVRNFSKSGLGVAHEGYLQTLGEIGPLGLFCQVAFLVIMVIAASRLIRRSHSMGKPEIRDDRILGFIGLGLVCGSFVGDFVASYFFLPPRQSLHVASLPQALCTWIVYSCVIYKDQLWRLARKSNE